MNEIILRDFHLSQNMDSPFAQGSLSTQFIGCTPQKQLGLVTPGRRPVGWTDDLPPFASVSCRAFIPWSFQQGYYFMSNNTVLDADIDNRAVKSVLHTRAPAAGSADCYNVIVYGQYIYYAMEKRLGRFDPATNTFNDNFGTFTNGNTSIYHPMRIVNDTLYIGDGDLIAQVDPTGTFVANALDIEPGFSVTALYNWSEQLIIGASSDLNTATFPARKQSFSKVYRWNTWSVSWDVSTVVNEEVIEGFIQANGGLFLLTQGSKVKIYRYAEPYCEMYTELPTGQYDQQNVRRATFYPMGFHDFEGRTLFALGNLPEFSPSYPAGIYSLYAKRAGYPPTVQCEYQFREYQVQGFVNYLCVNSIPGQFLLWSYAQSGLGFINNVTGVDVVSLAGQTDLQEYTMWTGIPRVDRANMKQFRVAVDMGYWTGDAVCQVIAYIGGGAPSAAQFLTMRRDDSRKAFISDEYVEETPMLQLKITITDTGSAVVDAIESIRLLFH